MTSHFDDYLHASKNRIEGVLPTLLDPFNTSYAGVVENAKLGTLKKAMMHSLLNGGKRVRPVLVYASAAAINGHDISSKNMDLDKAAAAVEMIHAYSLVHDDLPAMDDDDLRRGQPTCHIAFDEATAILAGDGLQARAFEILTELTDCSAVTQIQLIKVLSQAAGPIGMVGGQAIDLQSTDQLIDLNQLETIHKLKTGALIKASIAMGAILAGANPEQLQALERYGEAIGLAFQVFDDILDIEMDTATLGKQQGADQALNKATYPSLLGLQKSKDKAEQLYQEALAALESFDGGATPLRQLAKYIISRNH